MKREKIIAKRRKEVIKIRMYTFIMNYLGGTYISQVESSNEMNAIMKWCENLDVSSIKGLSKNDKKRLLGGDLKSELPVLIDGMKNVWYFLIETRRGFGHVNFVRS